MPSARQVEVAAEHFTVKILKAVRTRRAQRTQYGDTDFFGADVQGILPSKENGNWGPMLALVQAHMHDSNKTRKRKGLERLGGEEPVEPLNFERRIVVTWERTRNPLDGRKWDHWFNVEELVHEATLNSPSLEAHSQSRRPFEKFVWAQWTDPVSIPRDWYKAEKLEVPHV